MSFIELKKRRPRKTASSAEAGPETSVVPAGPGDPATLAAAHVVSGQAVLVAGLASWGEAAAGLAERAKTVVVVPGRLGAPEPKAAGKKAPPPAALGDADWAERLGEQRFDVILASEPLTHLADPLAFLRQARGLLKPDGALVALVPNVAFGETRLALLQGEFPGALDGSAPLHHYTRRRLRELLALAGYRLEAVEAYRQPLLGPDSPDAELYPEGLLQALGKEGDADASHFVARAVPASSEALLAELFEEQDALRKLTRHELAKAARTHDALTQLLKEADGDRARLARTLAEAESALAGMRESTDTAERNLRRLGDEADAAAAELAALKRTWYHRLAERFKRRPQPEVPAQSGPAPWVYEEPREHPSQG
jgi:SAM-dependent methyltransferase